MSKAVLISIKPKWCELIASGKKTIEVRKTRPKLETPFKCYIYATKVKPAWFNVGTMERLDGKVIGEFICDFIANYEAEFWDGKTFERIQEFYEPDDFSEYGEYEYKTIADSSDDFWKVNMLCKASCLTIRELRKYLGRGFTEFYGWHISDLVIYDKPKELSEFIKPCENDLYCEICAMYSEFADRCGNKALKINRPPQSWCYVEELGGNA